MTAVAFREEPVLAVVLCAPRGTLTLQSDPQIMVAELEGNHLATQHPEILQAVRTHPAGWGGAGGRVAYLLLFAGYPDEQVKGVSRDPELARLPVFMMGVPPNDSDEIQRAVADVGQELRRNPGFSIAVRTPEPTADEAAAVEVAGPGPSQVRKLTGTDRTGRVVLPTPDADGEQGALLSVAVFDGPGTSRQLRARQRELLADVQADLSGMSRARWILNTVSAGATVERQGALSIVPAPVSKRLGSRACDELDPSMIASELLVEMNLGRNALARRGWRITWSGLLILAPEFAYVGMMPSRPFAELAATTDEVLWVGTRVDPVPKPLGVEGVRFRAIHHDIAREIVEAVLVSSDLLAPPAAEVIE